jgi:DNA-binding winged helix-turn-helix (wHTH) protein/TolB-like protein
MIYRFGVFEFDGESKELCKNGRAAALEPQPARGLALLLSRPGDIISREELRDAVWGKDTHVDFERGLAYCVSQIRAALGDSGDNPRFVQTIPKRGFKFIAPVSSEGSAAVESIVPRYPPPVRPSWPMLVLGVLSVVGIGVLWLVMNPWAGSPNADTGTKPAIVGVSIFDNETGMPEHDRLVAGLSDLVVERLTKLDPERLAVIGNATILRQPRNIRNLKAVAANLNADYVLLGQLQKGENGLRFITHFIRLRDEAHLKANRLTMADRGVQGLEAAVVEEFDRATRDLVLNRPAN